MKTLSGDYPTESNVRMFQAHNELWQPLDGCTIRVVCRQPGIVGKAGYVSFQLISPNQYVLAGKTYHVRSARQVKECINTHSEGWIVRQEDAPRGISPWARAAATIGSLGGQARTAAKRAAARENGKHGGRPHLPRCTECGSAHVTWDQAATKVECGTCGAITSMEYHKSHQPEQAGTRLRVTPQES
jgi:hypothetical protein